MGWRSDWLYRLIFERIGHVWERAQQDAESRPDLFGAPPTMVLVSQYAAGDVARSLCLPPILRRWRYAGLHNVSLITDQDVMEQVAARRPPGVLYAVGEANFHITVDRKHVVFTYSLGPRYGRGMALRVCGQGARARFAGVEESVGWIS